MKNRFEISAIGMKMLHEGRPLWQLVKELIANCFDEEISLCSVSINTVGKGIIEVIVEDDGQGFIDIEDSWTLMKPTPKRSNPNVRGRFNIGEKELISVSRNAIIETVGKSVIFDLKGGRKVKNNKRENGTIITATVRGKQNEIQNTMETLRTFIAPKNVNYILNSNHIEVLPVYNREKITTFETTLKTVLASGLNEPIRNTTRKTKIDVYKPIKEKGGIYEMGIYIQDTEMPYDININQKVPLPPNRDVVSNSYLQDVYAEVLGRVKDEVSESNSSASWINLALEDDRTTIETVRVMKEKQIGTNTVLWSTDQQANEDAIIDGKDIIHGRTLNPIVREKYKEVGLQTSHDVYGADTIPRISFEDPTRDMLRVETYTRQLSQKLLGIDCEVTFSNNPTANQLASYNPSTNKLDFNVGRLGKKWFGNCPSEKHTSLIVHELGHANRGVNHHTGEYVDTLISMLTRYIHLENTWLMA